MQPSSQENQDTPASDHNDRPGTPPRPPYSPVTPVFAHLAPVHNSNSNGRNPIVPPAVSSPSPTTNIPPPPPFDAPATPRPVFAPEPVPVPISESDNPDAIALRSALSILQLQKQQSLRDIQTLDRMKRAAAADPEGFARELAAGNLTAQDKGGFINFQDDDQDTSTDNEQGDEGDIDVSNLGKIPTPQNVVRMPPVNWAKYQVVGDSLDKIHEDQRRRPSPGEPRRDESTQRAPEHVLASPYRPLVDRLENPADGKGTTNKSREG
ncbi:hypothetical protein ASPWEDRAFT_693332 [Aspergillus wentii DTO 134E9]|uniref:Uncharacterized protein n=1 Tax=Aspergillus wentii DTO 134E9 TaxID=1073089 RepID=A0A1L9R9E3_ASPWE|nr:uncharacterized protein ASPWEDRAFT_693332 [Aspergillus wentii DTO 134E9]KAI9926484.1 hypothetical protein MW887_004249 [Aspergillus wentii]OJJ31477.1 hypothetical protein ASPWEDRAFT_693332 [Aspergillus wentii DTO 134E9]